MDTQLKKRPIDEARERLKILSLEVADLVEDGTFYSINDAIVETLYKDDTNRMFKSYGQWKKEGYQVRKGERAFLLWARPKQIQRPLADSTAKEELEDMIKYFPLAYLFSNAQVDQVNPPDAQEAQKPINDVTQVLEPLEY